jgi:hypothetical protein
MALVYEYRYAIDTGGSDPFLHGITAPTGLSAEDIGDSSVEIDWTEGVSSDRGEWTVAAGPTVSLDGLTGNTRYAFQTRSKDEANNYSDPTPIFYETTPYTEIPEDVTPPSAPTGLMSLGETDSEIEIDWTEGTD